MGGEADLLNLLRWQIEAGADEAIGDAPVDRYAASGARKGPNPPADAEPLAAAETKKPAPALATREEVAHTARSNAAAAGTLEHQHVVEPPMRKAPLGYRQDRPTGDLDPTDATLSLEDEPLAIG